MVGSRATDTATVKPGLPPGPGGLGLGRLRHRLRDGLGFCEHVQREHGDIVYFRMLSRKFCLVSSPELIQEVLVTKASCFGKGPFYKQTTIIKNPTSLTADGDEHRRIRKLLQPSFSAKALQGYSEIMIQEALGMQAGWREGETIDISAAVNQMALNIAAKTFFGEDEQIPAAMIRDILTASAWSMALTLLPLGGLIAQLPLPRNRQRRRAMTAMDEVIYRVIDRARKQGEGRGDLISLLVNATDEDGFEKPLSDEEVRDESIILMLAGHETTASTLTWCFYYLSRNPEARERLEQEVDEVLDGRPPETEDYRKLTYARAVFNETLRLTPPIFNVGRSALVDCEIGGHRIPKGTVVQTFWRFCQRNKKYFPEAEQFKPERWLDAQASTHPKHAYLPFGGGARNCVGAAFGRMEAIFTMAAVSRRWRLDVVSPAFPAVRSISVYRLRHGLDVNVSRRTA